MNYKSPSLLKTLFAMAVIVLLRFQSGLAAEPDAKITIEYLNKVSDIWFEYHCLIRFGKAKNVYSADPGRIKEKWEKIGALDKEYDKSKVDQRVQSILWTRAQYEQLFQSRLKGKYQPYFYFLAIRKMAISNGNKVDDSLHETPDEQALLRRNIKFFNTFLKTQIKTSAYMKGSQWARETMIQQISNDSNYSESEKTQIVEALNKPFDIEVIMKSERKYLNDLHPDLLRSRNIDTLRAISAVKKNLDIFYTPESKKELLKYLGHEASLFFQAEKLAEMYESGSESIPELALVQYQYMRSQFFTAFHESMEIKASQSKDIRTKMTALQMTTLRYLDKSMPLTSFTKEELLGYGYDMDKLKNNRLYATANLVSLLGRFDQRLCVNPFHPSVIKKQAAIKPENFGFIGQLSTAKNIMQMELSADGSRLVVLEQEGVIEVIDMKTGKMSDPIFSLDKNRFERMAVTADGQVAYVITGDSQLLHIDLVTKKISQILKVKVPRKDALLAVSAKGDRLALGHVSKIFVYDVKTWRQIKELDCPIFTSYFYAIRFVSGGKQLLTRGNDPRFWLLNISTGKMKAQATWIENNNKYTRYVNLDKGYVIAGGSGGFSLFHDSTAKPEFHVELKDTKGYLLSNIRFDYMHITPNKRFVVSPEGVWDITNKKLFMRLVPRVKFSTTKWNSYGYHSYSACVSKLTNYRVTPDAERIIAAVNNQIYVAPLLLPLEAINPKSPKSKPTAEIKESQQIEMRQWTDSTGKKKINAILISFKKGIVQLKTEDDKTITLPLRKLSRKDRSYIRTHSRLLKTD